MVQTVKTSSQGTAHYTVLRAMCMAGERVEPGSSVELTPTQYAELKAANKVGPLAAPAPADKPAAKTTPPKEAKA